MAEERTNERTETHGCDLIYRQAAIDAVTTWINLFAVNRSLYNSTSIQDILRQLPSAQSERLTDDDFETIRIHLSAFKEQLCNQSRWKEAEEYQRIIDRFMAFATAQPEVRTEMSSADDTISRQMAIDIERRATVDTNPEHFESHQKFVEFMDDAEISSFGRWQWSNGFNTALTAVGIDLKRLPSAQPQIIQCKECIKEIGKTNPFDEDIESITVEDRENGRTRKFYPEETAREIQEVAIELLDRFKEEKQKQIAAMRMAAASSYERDQAKRKQAKLEKEVARYWKILESIGD